jgi:Fe-S-cluster containining protein
LQKEKEFKDGIQMEFCDKNDCSECCQDARVPLLNEDINKIIMHGYYDAYFVDEERGIKTLRTNDDGTCVFFNSKTRLCDVYQSRPERCRLNPYCICEQNHQPHVDEQCRHNSQIKEDPKMQERMSEYLATLQKEIEWRRKTGYYF